jgi:uncharacterized protein YbjT (DUF2867 family)
MTDVAVIGATCRIGSALVDMLIGRGHTVVAIGRSERRLGKVNLAAFHREADFTHPDTIKHALRGSKVVVNCAHAKFTGALLRSLPSTMERLVVVGSTRKFSNFRDSSVTALWDAEDALRGQKRPWTLLEPTMIYGAGVENNIGRVIRMLHTSKYLPLPDGGRNLVQPIYFKDVAACLNTAVEREEGLGDIIIAGPEELTFETVVRTAAQLMGVDVTIVPVPLSIMKAGLALAQKFGVKVPINGDELRRFGEHKAFSTSDMRSILGADPRPFEKGLHEMLTELSKS